MVMYCIPDRFRLRNVNWLLKGFSLFRDRKIYGRIIQ